MLKKAIKDSKLLKVIAVIVTILIGVYNTNYGQIVKIPIVSPDNTTGLSYPISKVGFSIWEAIYPFWEINHSGYLTNIRFACSIEADAVIYKNVRVYAQTVDSLSLPSGKFDSTYYTLIYEGDLCVPPESGYAVIQLTVPFYYNCSDKENLMLAIERNDDSYAGGNNINPWFQSVGDSKAVNRYGFTSGGGLPNYLYNIASVPFIELEIGCRFHIPIQDKYKCYGTTGVQIGNGQPVYGSSSNYTYSWEPGDSLDDPTSQNPISYATATQTYYLTIQGDDGCSGWVETMTLYTDDPAPVIIMGQQNAVSAQSGTFYDSGGNEGDYSNDEDYTLTIYPCDNQSVIDIIFTDFDVDEDGDWLKIYNGDNTSCPLFDTYTGSENIGEFVSTHSTGALTFVFHSDDATTGNGWAANFYEIPNCTNLTTLAPAHISDPGDDLHSGATTLSLEGDSTYFLMWQYSYDGSNFYEIQDSWGMATYSTGINNTTTYYRAMFRTTNSSIECPDNVVEYSTSNNYYVNDNDLTSDKWCTALGDPSNDGLSPDKPLDALSTVIENYDLKKGDTIFIDAGIYYDNIDINGNDYGDDNDTTYRIVLLGAGKDLTHILPQYDYTNPVTINSTYGLEFNGLDFKDSTSNYYSDHFYVWNSGNILIQNCSLINNGFGQNIYYWRDYDNGSSKLNICNNYLQCSEEGEFNINLFSIYDCNIKNNVINNTSDIYTWGGGIRISWDCKNIRINKNYIHSPDYGIYLGDNSNGDASKNVQITDNYVNVKDTISGSIAIAIHGISSYSLNKINNNYIKGGYTAIEAPNIRNTRIFNNFIFGSQIGISLSSFTYPNNYSVSISNVGIYSNSFYNSKTNISYSGVTSSGGLNLENNIFYNTSTSSTDFCLSMDGCSNNGNGNLLDTCDYNLYYAPNGAKLAKFGSTLISDITTLKTSTHVVGSGVGDANSIYGDPEYFNPESGNLSVYQSSLVFGHGTQINGINYDIHHNTLASPYSIGASAKSTAPGSPNGPYAELKRKLDGGYHLSTSPYLQIKYMEEYNPLNSKFKFKIYDMNGIVAMSDSSSDIVNNTPIKYGDNYYSIKLFGCKDCGLTSLTNDTFYLLEVSNDKNEKWYLRFKYNYTYDNFTQYIMCACAATPDDFETILQNIAQ